MKADNPKEVAENDVGDLLHVGDYKMPMVHGSYVGLDGQASQHLYDCCVRQPLNYLKNDQELGIVEMTVVLQEELKESQLRL